MYVSGIGQCSLDYLFEVDTYPLPDTKKEVLSLHEESGGPVATALVALSRLEIPCRFNGITGDDDAGKKIRASLEKENVDVRGLLERKNTTSQIAFIAIEKGSARRTIFWKRPSGNALQKNDLPDDFFAHTRFLLLDGLMREVSLYAAGCARDLNIPVMLDAGRARPGMLEIARYCDYVVASEEFARDLQWKMTEQGLSTQRMLLGVKILTVTLGHHGSVTVSGDGFIRVPAFTVEAVDTTGAGDVFHGGYLYGLLQGWELSNVLLFASALAALKCRKIGGRSGIPKLAEVRDFLSATGHRFL
jgi:ribokinase